MNEKTTVYIVGNGRCYHTIDWFRSLQRSLPVDSWVFFTDCISLGNEQQLLLPRDNFQSLVNIDKFLLAGASPTRHFWRNLVKFLLTPIQSFVLRQKFADVSNCIIHAHTFYYGLICRTAGLSFIFTPQGFELTERPKNSKIYAFLMSWVLAGAERVLVDSERMRVACVKLGSKKVEVSQYGVDTNKCLAADVNHERTKIVSNRGIEENYRINHIISSRNATASKLPITFIYPLSDLGYYRDFLSKLDAKDRNLGTISKDDCYKLYAKASLVISIPISDSSPRSVYEAIFCGAPVATVYSPWIDNLPKSMRDRVVVLNPLDEGWFCEAISFADKLRDSRFTPCSEAVGRFDQFNVTKNVYNSIYKPLLTLHNKSQII